MEMRLAVMVCGVAAIAAAQAPELRLLRVAGGISGPVAIESARDGSGRLFIVQQRGRIRILNNTDLIVQPFLDITDRVYCGITQDVCGERGMLGLAFSPSYASNGRFYVFYTALNGDLTISRFRVSADPNRADPASEKIVLTIQHRQAGNHNGGQLAFGRDGYLYIGTGDGGGSGDQFQNGQNTNSLLGKILRIDVESQPEGTYTVPATNPFVGRGGFRGEIWAYGLRNPWRFSFDRETGDLYIGDVGQDRLEEVNFQPGSSAGGENYGWNRMEGSRCYDPPSCSMSGLTLPIFDYANTGSDDCSVTGGYVYRGARFPAMRGFYFFADWCSGKIRALWRENGAWRSSLLNVRVQASAFGEDEDGDLYAAEFQSGVIYLLSTGLPSFTLESVVNAASGAPGLSPGSIGTIYGARLTTVNGIAQATTYPLPRELAGTSVTVSGYRAPLYAVASVGNQEQINFQVPWEVAAGATEAVIVTNSARQSDTIQIPVLAAHPGIFLLAEGHAAATDAQFNVISSGNPLARGTVGNVFATGLGAVDIPPTTGQAAPSNPPARTVTDPVVTVGGRNATMLFSGLAPGFAGLYQVQFRVPADVPIGLQDLVITMNGVASNPAKLAVR